MIYRINSKFHCPAFKVFYHLISIYPFAVISYNFPSGILYSAELKSSALSAHSWSFLSCTCSHNLRRPNALSDVWMSKSHFSGHCRLPTHNPFSSSTWIFSAVCPKLSPRKWILRENQTSFPTPRMSLGSLMPTCTSPHPGHRWRVNMYPRHTNQGRS